MRIIIDMQGLQSKFSGHRGVGRYTENIVKGLLRINKRHEVILALNGALDHSIDEVRFKFSSFLKPENIVVWHNSFPLSAFVQTDNRLVRAGEVIREVFLNSFNPDLIISTNLQEGLGEDAVTSVKNINSSAIYISTLHDLVPFHYEKEYLSNEKVRAWYLSKIDHVKRSDVVLTVSHASKREIISFLGVPENRIHVVENGCDHDLFNADSVTDAVKKDVLGCFQIVRPFIFYYGGNDKHKNLARLIEAYSDPASGVYKRVDLVLGGREILNDESLVKIIDACGVADKVLRVGYIADADLPLLIKCSEFFIFPSTHEGFGLPVLEAMACGVPVLGANASSIKEIIDFEAALFDPMDCQDISKKMSELLSSPSLRASISLNGLKRANFYTWDRAAESLLAVIDSVELDGGRDVWKDSWLGKAVFEIKKLALDESSLLGVAKSIAETFPPSRSRMIFLDISSVFVNDHRSGIQRVVRAISVELLKVKMRGLKAQLVFTSVEDLDFYAANSYVAKIIDSSVVASDEVVEFLPGDSLVYLDLHPSVAISHVERTRHLVNKGVQVFHVVYDLLPLLKPATFWPELCSEFKQWAEAVSVASGALCISRTVAGELRDYLSDFGEKRVTPFKIGYFHLGADIENSAPSKGLPLNFSEVFDALSTGTTFLMVGTIESRKGYRQVLQAFKILWERGQDVNLVMVGRLGWGMDDFPAIVKSEKNLGIKFFWLNGISDEYLDLLYKKTACLIAASEGEGFGLPLIEAAQRKIPIIARDIPVFREVAGENAVYFADSKNPEVVVDAVTSWRVEYLNATHVRSDSLAWLTWRQSAKAMVDVIEDGNWLYEINCRGVLLPGGVHSFSSSRVKWKGFADAESDFRWSSASDSSLSFLWASADTKTSFSLRASSFGRQRVRVSCNDIFLKEFIFFGESAEIVFPLPNLVRGENIISFNFPDATMPGGGDSRFIALAVIGFEFLESHGDLVKDVVYGHKSNLIKWSGFAGAEVDFRWSAARDCSIVFNSATESENLSMILKIHSLGRQKIGVVLNSIRVLDVECNDSSTSILIPLKSLQAGANIMKFILPDARQPSSSDSRLLAFAVYSVQIID